MKALIHLSICLGVVLLIGCGPKPEASDAGASTKTPAELVKAGLEETDELKFCLSEEAGMTSIKQSSERLSKIVEALPESVAASTLAQGKKDQLTVLIGSLKTADENLASSVESQASVSDLSKANAKVRKELISISKITL